MCIRSRVSYWRLCRLKQSVALEGDCDELSAALWKYEYLGPVVLYNNPPFHIIFIHKTIIRNGSLFILIGINFVLFKKVRKQNENITKTFLTNQLFGLII